MLGNRVRFNLILVGFMLVMFVLAGLSSGPVLAQQAPLAEDQKAVEVKRLLELGQSLFRQKKPAEAFRVYEDIIKIDPEKSEAYYFLAILSFQRRDYEGGLRYLSYSLKLTPDNQLVNLALAKALEETGRLDLALAQYEKLMKMVGQDSAKMQHLIRQRDLLLLKLYPQKGARVELDATAQRMLKAESGSQDVMHVVGFYYIKSGQFDKAESIYKTLTSLAPGKALYALYLGNVYEAKKDYEQAEAYFERAAKIRPESNATKTARVKLGISRGNRYYAKGDKELALQEFLKVLELVPDDIGANMSLAAIYREKGEFDKAKPHYEHVLSLDPKHLEARFYLMTLHLARLEYSEGVMELERLLILSKGGPFEPRIRELEDRLVKQVSIEFLQKVRGLNKRMLELEQELAGTPDNIDLRFEYAKVLFELNRLEAAEKEFMIVLDAKPAHPAAHRYLAKLYERQKKNEEAIIEYKKAMAMYEEGEDLFETQREMLLLVGKTRGGAGDLEKAEEAYLQVLNRFKKDQQAHLGIALVRGQLGDINGSIEWYDKLLALYPEDVGSRMRLAALYERVEEEDKAIKQYRLVLLDSAAPEQLKIAAQEQIDNILRSINGFRYVLQYGLGIDSQITNDTFEYRSDTAATVVYNYKIKKGMRFSLTVNPTYSTYHIGQHDYLSIVFYPSLSYDAGNLKHNVGLQRSSRFGVLIENQSITVSDNYSYGISWKGDDDINYQTRLTYSGFVSEANPFFDANTYIVNWSASTTYKSIYPMSYGYSLTFNDSKRDLGNDYEYISHSMNGKLTERVSRNFSRYMSAATALTLYSNPDSLTNYSEKRRNLNLSLGAGFDYRFNKQISLFGSYRYIIQKSSLKVGAVLTDIQAIEGRRQEVMVQQNASLGDYSNHSFGAGIRLHF